MVTRLLLRDQQVINTVVITNEDTENLFTQEEFNLCITCPNDGAFSSLVSLICRIYLILCQKRMIIEENMIRGQKRPAEKMLTNTAKKLPLIKIDSCVLLPIYNNDRDPSEMQNLMRVVTDYKNGVYQVGCAAGRIKSWFNRPDLM
nr:unnamed protein product [Callosobruchus chinensis]